MTGYLFYIAALTGLIVSFVADRRKTGAAMIKAWQTVLGILPELVGILVLIGIALAFLDPPTISRLIGADSGWWGVVASAVVGSVTLIPAIVAFPNAAILLDQGAGVFQIGAFVTTLMMVGVVTFPLERRYFGVRLALARNLLAFVLSFAVAAAVWFFLER